MFNFIKKGTGAVDKEDKEKKKSEKKEKKENKKREKRSMTAEELLRLDEMRRSLKIRRKKEKDKLPSGITADYSANFLAELRECAESGSVTGIVNLSNHNATISVPEIHDPPLPPKRGILKLSGKPIISVGNTNDTSSIIHNSSNSELYGDIAQKTGDFQIEQCLSPEDTSSVGSGDQAHCFLAPSVVVTNHGSIESLEDSTTNSSFVTPPISLSPVGDSHYLDVEFPLPDIEPVNLPEPRTLTICRQSPPRTDFGFSLRKAMVIKRDAVGVCYLKPVIFAEPGAVAQHCNDTGLLPGDQLLEVNGFSIDKKSREEVIDMIKSSGNYVTLKVQPVAELSELSCRKAADGRIFKLDDSNIRSGTLKKSSSCRSNGNLGKCEKEIPVEEEWLWLVHQSGFSQVSVQNISNSKVSVQCPSNGESVLVDEDDLEKPNPKHLNKCENLVQLRYLNESSFLHVLRQRYASNLIHTYAGNTLLIINPMAPLALYSEKIVHMFRGCKSEDMPPHIYSVAQATYQSMLSSRRDHSIVLLGRSGGGKTTNFQHLLYYLCLTAGPSKVVSTEKLNATWTVLEAFGNAKTICNGNGTRFAHIFGLDFDQSGQISSASVQVFLFDYWRLIKRREEEGIFHVFNYLLHGSEGPLRRDLLLDQLSHTGPLLPINSTGDERSRATIEFSRLCSAFKTLGVTQVEMNAIYSVLAAILHFGVASAQKIGASNRWQFKETTSAQRACNLVGCNVDELANILFGVNSSPTAAKKTDADFNGLDMLEGFIIGLYQEIISVVTALINRSLSSTGHSMSSVLVVDCPGWQTPSSMGSQYTATLSDLFYNYLAEKLQGLFYFSTITAPLQKYIREDVEVAYDLEPEGENNMISVLENVGSSLGSSSQTDLRMRPGILWIIEELAAHSSPDISLNDKIFVTYNDRESQNLICKGSTCHNLILNHCQGTNPVVYSTDGWLKQARGNRMVKISSSILQQSSKVNINVLFSTWRSVTLNGSVAGLNSIYSLNRGSSLRRTIASGTSGSQQKSAVLHAKFMVDGLIETLQRTKMNFVNCLLPHENAGLLDLSATPNSISSMINVPLLRCQMRSCQILQSIRLYKQGFPDSMPLPEFNRRFSLLGRIDLHNIRVGKVKMQTGQDKAITLEILQVQDLDPALYRIGINQIFTRAGVLSHLENIRDEKLSDRIGKLQTYCRGYLARKKFAIRKVEDVAVRCIQRNVRKFLLVQDWPWWRLLIKIMPLLNLHRTEELLKIKMEELESLKIKFEKLEQDRIYLKQENSKLEAKINELAVDLAEEHSSSTFTAERLNMEKADKIRLEKELQQLQVHKKHLEENSERLELELVCAHTANINGVDVEFDEGEHEFVARERYERVLRELEYMKHRMHQQHENDMDHLQNLKKQLEKKLGGVFEELEEQKQVGAQWKRKFFKLNAEMNDVRLLLEEQNSRNNVLEKKQRRFDSEFHQLAEELKQEKLNKDKVAREKDLLFADKCSLEQNFNTTKLELELKEQRIQSLTEELSEVMFSGNIEEDIAFLKKAKHQIENKLKENEEELDDLAGQVQLLEQTKLKLEMSLEQLRKEHRRELSQKDEELEEIRASAHKKVKALECQLEAEHSERTSLLKERHEIDCRLSEAEETARTSQAYYQEQILKLRKDLKKTKALLRDAQITIQQSQAETPNKALLRQLRNQIEDAECARLTAIKGKQHAEAEISEAVTAMEDALKIKQEVEEKLTVLMKEKSNLQIQLDENEEELTEVLKKYRASVGQVSAGQLTIQEQNTHIAELESERSSLKERVAELQSRLENMETLADPTSSYHVKRYQLKTKELESKLELEQTTRTRIEVQVTRLKETTEKLQNELELSRSREQAAQESLRKAERALRETREKNILLAQHDAEASSKKKELEKRLESSEAETAAVRADLRLAMQRVEDLQCAIQGDLDGNITASESSVSDSESSDDSVATFQSKSSKIERSSISFNSTEKSSIEYAESITQEQHYAKD